MLFRLGRGEVNVKHLDPRQETMPHQLSTHGESPGASTQAGWGVLVIFPK